MDEAGPSMDEAGPSEPMDFDSTFELTDPTVEESTIDDSFNCEVQAGELPTRALSGVVAFEVAGSELTLRDLEALDGRKDKDKDKERPPVPLDIVGQLTKIDKVMDPVPGAELGPAVRLTGVTEWSVEYDGLAAMVWVSTATADYRLVSTSPPYAPLWQELELKTLLAARCISLLTENKNQTFGQLRQLIAALNEVEGNPTLEFDSACLIAHGGFIADQIGASAGMVKCKALQGMRQEIRRLMAPPNAAELQRRAEVAERRAEKEAAKEAADAEKLQKKAEKDAEKAAKAEADKQKKVEKEQKAKADKAKSEAQAAAQAAHQKQAAAAAAAAAARAAAGGSSGAGPSAGAKRPAEEGRAPPPPLEKKRTKFETYAAATASVQNPAPPPAAPGSRPDKYKRQRVVLDAPHALPPGAIVWTRTLTRKLETAQEEDAETGKNYSNKSGIVLGQDGTDEDCIYYHVQIHDDLEIIRVKFGELLQRLEVELVGLQARPDLNGAKGFVEGLAEDKGRYSIKVQQMGKKDEWVNIKPANSIVPSPARVRLVGLVGSKQYNGRIVKVVKHDPEAGRYEVTMFEDEDTKLVPKILRVKYENAQLW